MEFPLENEIILEHIFRYLNNSNLLSHVALTCPKWNQVAGKFVQQKRQISLNNSNICSYVKMILGGGTPHKYIKFSLENTDRFRIHDIQGSEDRIISSLATIQENIRELVLHSSKWQIGFMGAFSEMPTETEANLFSQIIQGAKNVESLSLKINTGSIGNYHVDIPNLLQLSNLKQFHNLKSMEIGVGECGNPYFTQIILAFLSSAPNIERVNLTNDLSLAGFATIETQFPGFIQKVEALFYENFTEEIANFLLSKNFPSLKKLELNLDVDPELYLRVLEKYKDQLEYILMDLQVVNDGNVWVQPTIKLPLMRNLQILKLVNSCVNLDNPRSLNVRFWDTSETENIFPNLKEIIVELEDAMENFSKDYNPMPDEILEQILTATFPDIPNHPIFPGLKDIDLDKIRGLEKYMFSMNPELCTTMKKYCPNLFCRSAEESINFVSTESKNFLLRE